MEFFWQPVVHASCGAGPGGVGMDEVAGSDAGQVGLGAIVDDRGSISAIIGEEFPGIRGFISYVAFKDRVPFGPGSVVDFRRV